MERAYSRLLWLMGRRSMQGDYGPRFVSAWLIPGSNDCGLFQYLQEQAFVNLTIREQNPITMAVASGSQHSGVLVQDVRDPPLAKLPALACGEWPADIVDYGRRRAQGHAHAKAHAW